MRTLTASVIASLDGYTAAAPEQGGVMALPMDHSFDQHNATVLRGADGLLLGASTFRMFVSFWPDAATMPGATDATREIAARYADGLPITVVSDSLTPDDLGPWRDQTTVVPRLEVADTVKALTTGDDGTAGDLVVFGSSTMTHELFRLGLVDVVHVLTAPVVLGAGVRASPDDVPLELTRTDVRTWEGSGNTLTSYRVGR